MSLHQNQFCLSLRSVVSPKYLIPSETSVLYSVISVALYLPENSGCGFLPHEPPQLPAHEIAFEPGSSIISAVSSIVVTPSRESGPY